METIAVHNVIPSKKLSTIIMAFVFVVSWINPVWPAAQAAHNSLTLVAFYVLWTLLKRYSMTDFDYFLIILFLCLHTAAAHWLYSNVPYDAWAKNLLGTSLSELFGWQRNHFDRLVHFLYGFCLTPATMSLIHQKYHASKKNSFLIVLGIIISTSVFYEWLEWIVAISVPAADAEAYNGQQGDAWDAHKDMLLATLGCLVWAVQFIPKRRTH